MWLLFSLSIPFSEVILHTKMEQLKQKLKKMDDVKNAWSKEKDQLNARKKEIENNLRCLFFYFGMPNRRPGPNKHPGGENLRNQ